MKNIELSSSHSIEIALDSIRNGDGRLNAHRKSMLDRVPNQNDWSKFPRNFITIKDLAFLTAQTNDEFALLRGKREDILFHGNRMSCNFNGVLVDMLIAGKIGLVAHSHPGEIIPIPSDADRKTLKIIKQNRSSIISAITGSIISYSSDPFEM